MQNENGYNGWANYATWRVKLEMFDGFDVQDLYPVEVAEKDVYGLSLQLKEYANNIICDPFANSESLAVDYALAFLQDVHWYEIAEHMVSSLEQ
jgi:hypothetical protein